MALLKAFTESKRIALEHLSDTAATVLGASYIVSGGIDDDESRLVTNYAKLADAAAEFGLGLASPSFTDERRCPKSRPRSESAPSPSASRSIFANRIRRPS